MQLHFQSYGQGPPLIVLHGLFGSLANWHSMSRHLAERFHVLAVDQRNHGGSPHSPEMSYPLMAADLADFIQTHRLGRAHVLGHSMGGKTAMQFALLHPEKVDRLIVVDIAPRAYSPRHSELLEALLSLDLPAFHERGQMDAALAPVVPDRPVRQFLLKNVTREPGGAFHWKLNLEWISKNYAHLGEALRPGHVFNRPALFLRGSDSRYVCDEDRPAIRRLFPKAELRTIPGAGHWVHADAPTAFLEATIEFLNGTTTVVDGEE